jgi:ribosome-associated protein
MPLMQQETKIAASAEYDAAAIARNVVDICEDRKASDITLIEIGRVTTLADYFVLCTGNSERQIGALSRAIQEGMRERKVPLLHSEGVPQDGWILLDYGQVIVHVFSADQRDYYGLEQRWKEAPTLLRIQ